MSSWLLVLLTGGVVFFLINNEVKIMRIGKSMNMGYRMRDLLDDRLWGLSLLLLCIFFDIFVYGISRGF